MSQRRVPWRENPSELLTPLPLPVHAALRHYFLPLDSVTWAFMQVGEDAMHDQRYRPSIERVKCRS